MSPVLFIHVAAGAVGLVSGFAAISVRKGERLHRLAGTVFFLSMLVMSALGAAIAAGMREPLAFVPGLVTFYLVATAWGAVRREEGRVGHFESAACGGAMAVSGIAVALGSMAGSGPVTGTLLAFAALAALGAGLDLRTIRRGGVSGGDRIARHLWRMCAALTIAAFSFFLGQQDEFPQALRGGHLAIPPLTVLGVMVFWLVRLRRPARRTGAAQAA